MNLFTPAHNVHGSLLSPAVGCPSPSTPRFFSNTKRHLESVFRLKIKNLTRLRDPYHAISTTPGLSPQLPTPSSLQYRFLVGSGLGLLVALLSSRPLCLNHFLVPNSNSRSSSPLGSFLCMKLQKPPRTQPSPLLSRQQASRKSVTGESSQ